MVYFPIDIERAIIKECKRRNYSDRTIKTYNYCIKKFLDFTNKSIDKISKKDVRLFLEHLSKKEKAGSTMNLYHMAIRFLFEDILDKRIWIDIRYSKVPKTLPIVLTKEEIKRLFDNIENEKHKLMIQLMYSAGLRVSELLNLKVKDIEIEKNYGFVRHGKGNKDRIFILSEKLKPKIKELIDREKLLSENYIFNSNRNTNYNVSSLRHIVKNATKKAKINKKVHSHTLRHSFATHLIEDGYSVSEVQALLGHKSPETTFIYLHTASPTLIKVKSPIDNLL